MNRIETYRVALQQTKDWEPYLRRESRLPGPRANLELLQAFVEEGDRTLFERLLRSEPVPPPVNNPDEFLQVCGIVGLGRLLAEGDRRSLARLRKRASDPRWRIREAVAMALQRWGDSDREALFAAMEDWAGGSAFEQRAAAAAVSEPRLLSEPAFARQALALLNRITTALPARRAAGDPGVGALRQALSYCWSVAAAALPPAGKRAMGKWLSRRDADIRWIMRENLKKQRLARMDAAWVAEARALLDAG